MDPYVLITYYSRYGATADMAEHIAVGVEKAQIEARVRSIPAVGLSHDPQQAEVPSTGAPYVTLDDLEHCSGLALGSPGYFGNMASPVKYFLEQTIGLWKSGALIDKPAAVFTSTATMHGGQEAVLLSMMLPLMHQGMCLIGIPYSEETLSSTTTGGAPYGATHVDGAQGENPLSAAEKELCIALGHRLGRFSRIHTQQLD